MVSDLEQVDETDSSEFDDEKLNTKEVISPKFGEIIPKTADGELKFVGGDQDLRTPP